MLFSPITSKVFGGLSVALVVVVVVLKLHINSLGNQLDAKVTLLANEKAAHQITRNSIATLEAALETCGDSIKAAATAQTEATLTAQEALKATKQANATLVQQAARIRAERPTSDKCKSSDAVMEADL